MSPSLNLANLTQRSIISSPQSFGSGVPVSRRQTYNKMMQSQLKMPMTHELNQRLEALVTKREGN